MSNRSVTTESSRPPQNERAVKSNFPWRGFCGLFLAVAGAIAVSVVLWATDGSLVENWTFQTSRKLIGNEKLAKENSWAANWFEKNVSGTTASPNVLISVIMIVVSFGIQLAFSEGIAVWWWRQVYKNKTTDELQEDWEVAGSKAAALKADFNLKQISVMSVATILVAILAMANPLLQKAVSLQFKDVVLHDHPVAVTIAQAFPGFFYTGFAFSFSIEAEPPSHGGLGQRTAVSQRYIYARDVEYPYSIGMPIQLFNSSGCDGLCKGTILAPGFAVDCNASEVPFDLNLPGADSNNLTYKSGFVPLLACGIGGDFYIAETNHINVTTIVKTDPACKGKLQKEKCTLTPALVAHDVYLYANASEPHSPFNVTFVRSDSQTLRQPNIVKIFDAPQSTMGYYSDPALYGGIYLSLLKRFEVAYSMQRTWEEPGIEVAQYGAWDPKYLNVSGMTGYEIDSIINIPSCDMSFHNSMLDDILLTARDLLFRSAALAGSLQSVKQLPQGISRHQWFTPSKQDAGLAEKYQNIISTTQTRTAPAYLINYSWLGGALAVILVSTMSLTPLFYRFWTIGERKNLSPKDTAPVFAPVATSTPRAAIEAVNAVGTVPHSCKEYVEPQKDVAAVQVQDLGPTQR